MLSTPSKIAFLHELITSSISCWVISSCWSVWSTIGGLRGGSVGCWEGPGKRMDQSSSACFWNWMWWLIDITCLRMLELYHVMLFILYIDWGFALQLTDTYALFSDHVSPVIFILVVLFLWGFRGVLLFVNSSLGVLKFVKILSKL